MTYTLNAWGIYFPAICIPDYGCFASPPQLWVHLRATSGRILMNLFFRRHGHTRVLDTSYGSNQIYSNIRFQIISSWSDICNICLAFWTECDGNSSTSFSKIGLYEIKRQESTRLRTFLFCVVQIEIASPTACDQGQNLSRGFMSLLGASLNPYNWYLKKNMSNILLYSSQT